MFDDVPLRVWLLIVIAAFALRVRLGHDAFLKAHHGCDDDAAFVVALLDSDDPPHHGDDEEDREQGDVKEGG
jgi:hypothetical protein